MLLDAVERRNFFIFIFPFSQKSFYLISENKIGFCCHMSSSFSKKKMKKGKIYWRKSIKIPKHNLYFTHENVARLFDVFQSNIVRSQNSRECIPLCNSGIEIVNILSTKESTRDEIWSRVILEINYQYDKNFAVGISILFWKPSFAGVNL